MKEAENFVCLSVSRCGDSLHLPCPKHPSRVWCSNVRARALDSDCLSWKPPEDLEEINSSLCTSVSSPVK